MNELTPLGEQSFIDWFNIVQADAVATNKKNGFNTDDVLAEAFEAVLNGCRPDIAEKYGSVFKSFKNARAGLKLALMMGELGETLEAVRKNKGPDEHCPEFTNEEVELADTVLRAMNYANDRGLRLGEALIAKNRFNRDRIDHSREARASEHGKRF